MSNDALLRAIGLTTRSDFARSIGVTGGLIWQWSTGARPISPLKCIAIERLTGVTCEELRPDVRWLRDKSGQVVGMEPMPREKPRVKRKRAA